MIEPNMGLTVELILTIHKIYEIGHSICLKHEQHEFNYTSHGPAVHDPYTQESNLTQPNSTQLVA